MILLKEYDLNLKSEWENYIHYFDKYLLEVSQEDGFEYENVIEDKMYKKNIIDASNRLINKFHVCKIMNDEDQIGFVDYICWINENGKSIIGNFYINKNQRNKGYGSKVLVLVEKALRNIGARYIEITPSKRGLSLYLRNRFVKTNDKSLENGEIAYRKQLD